MGLRTLPYGRSGRRAPTTHEARRRPWTTGWSTSARQTAWNAGATFSSARPDGRAGGSARLRPAAWDSADAIFHGRVGGGRWIARGRAGTLPNRWPIVHAGLRFAVGCAPSGHTGLFPEQAAHWAWMAEALTGGPELPAEAPAILNLFAYTGGASVALARAGARVTHVDASRPAIGWARENAALNDVSTIRWIHEDARRFVDREHRRGRRYDGLLLDPAGVRAGPGRGLAARP